MKEKRFKRGILLLVLALLLLIPTSITLAKYTAVNDVGTVTLTITGDPTVLDRTWKKALTTITTKTMTKLVVDSFDRRPENLSGVQWTDGKPIGEKTGGNYTKGVRLFEVDNTAYILARGTGFVEFPENSQSLFSSLSNVKTITFSDKINTANVTNMKSMFFDCKSLTSLDLSNFDTRNVTDMSHMFQNCQKLPSLDVSSFKTSKVTDMSLMFTTCAALTSLDLSNFDTRNVTNMRNMFQNCQKLTSLNLSSFDTSKVTRMDYMFYNCSALPELDLSRFNTENVTNMERMFSFCSELTSLDLSSFNTKNVTNMRSMFENCRKLTSLDLSSFNTKSGPFMFRDCITLKQVRLGEKFQFNISDSTSYLPTPDSANISGADGKWYTAGSNPTGYAPDVLASQHNRNATTTTYYAVKANVPAAAGTGYSLRPAAAAPPTPVTPVDPAAPVDPTDPVTPVDPVDPVTPVAPTDPVTPVTPIDPAAPVDPVNPVTPGEETGTGASQDNPTTTE